MSKYFYRCVAIAGMVFAPFCVTAGSPPGNPVEQSSAADAMTDVSVNDSDAKLQADAFKALNALYEKTPKAKALGEQAKAILIFPSIFKAGVIVGGHGGSGVLIENGEVTGYYKNAAMSVGYQVGAQAYSEILFLMSNNAVDRVKNGSGWSIGMGPSIVIVDAGMAKSMTTTTLKSDVYAFIFGQEGLMAGTGLQGQKITRRK